VSGAFRSSTWIAGFRPRRRERRGGRGRRPRRRLRQTGAEIAADGSIGPRHEKTCRGGVLFTVTLVVRRSSDFVTRRRSAQEARSQEAKDLPTRTPDALRARLHTPLQTRGRDDPLAQPPTCGSPAHARLFPPLRAAPTMPAPTGPRWRVAGPPALPGQNDSLISSARRCRSLRRRAANRLDSSSRCPDRRKTANVILGNAFGVRQHGRPALPPPRQRFGWVHEDDPVKIESRSRADRETRLASCRTESSSTAGGSATRASRPPARARSALARRMGPARRSAAAAKPLKARPGTAVAPGRPELCGRPRPRAEALSSQSPSDPTDPLAPAAGRLRGAPRRWCVVASERGLHGGDEVSGRPAGPSPLRGDHGVALRAAPAPTCPT